MSAQETIDNFFDDVADTMNKSFMEPEGYDKVDHFANIAQSMVNIYDAKNADYGDSFSESVKEFGYISAVVRMSDKFNRLKNLLVHNQKANVKTESIKDTLLDLASYSVMLIMEIENAEQNEGTE